MSEQDDRSGRLRVPAYLVRRAALLGAAAAAAVGIYAWGQSAGNRAPTPIEIGSPAPELGAFIPKHPRQALPAVSFQDADGHLVALETFRNRVVLLNLWAPWCVPCRTEMPALDRLQAKLGSSDFEVVALSVDRSGIEGARKFLDSVGVKALKPFADPTAKLGSTLRAVGLPTTLLVDRQGREVARSIGPADWDGAEVEKLIRTELAN